MQDGKLSGPSLVSRLGRALVVLSSAGLAALVVLRAGGVAGCDGPAAPEQVAPAAAEPVKAEAVKAEAVNAEPVKPEPVKPEVVKAAAETAELVGDRRGEGGNADEPVFIGGSKSGVLIKPPSLKREPAVKEPAQQQQAAPR